MSSSSGPTGRSASVAFQGASAPVGSVRPRGPSRKVAAPGRDGGPASSPLLSTEAPLPFEPAEPTTRHQAPGRRRVLLAQRLAAPLIQRWFGSRQLSQRAFDTAKELTFTVFRPDHPPRFSFFEESLVGQYLTPEQVGECLAHPLWRNASDRDFLDAATRLALHCASSTGELLQLVGPLTLAPERRRAVVEMLQLLPRPRARVSLSESSFIGVLGFLPLTSRHTAIHGNLGAMPGLRLTSSQMTTLLVMVGEGERERLLERMVPRWEGQRDFDFVLTALPREDRPRLRRRFAEQLGVTAES